MAAESFPLLLPRQTTEPALCTCTGSWTNAMQVVSFSEARESFKAVLDRVEADADVTHITRRRAQAAVVMSLDSYNSLMETVHLLRSPANAAHLQLSLEQADQLSKALLSSRRIATTPGLGGLAGTPDGQLEPSGTQRSCSKR